MKVVEPVNLSIKKKWFLIKLTQSHHKESEQHWAISNNGFRSDSLYEKKIGEDLVFNNALPKSLTINTSRMSEGKTKIA